MTASWALYRDLSLPSPWNPARDEDTVPLIINGGATAVGSFAIKLARLSNVHPIIATARRGTDYVSSLLDADRGDVCLDYQQGLEGLPSAIRSALRGAKVRHAIEAVGDSHSVDMLKNVVEDGGTISMALPSNSPQGSDSNIKMLVMSSTSVHESWGPAPPGAKTFGFMMSQFFGHSLQGRSLAGHPVRAFSGLNSLQEALDKLKAGEASATKFVVTM